MSYYKKFVKDAANKSASLAGDAVSANVHRATDEAIHGMDLFKAKADQIKNVGAAQAKGNLFEYIEAAKFNQDAALKNSKIRAHVTDAMGDPHAAADILLKDNGKTVDQAQLKASHTFKNGKPTSAASSVFYQAGGEKGQWGKYKGMQRVILKQTDYDDQGSLLDASKRIAANRAGSNGIHAADYQDTYENLTDGLHYKNISSGGTTYEELEDAHNNPSKYARRMEHKQVAQEMKVTAVNMAAANAVTSGIISGVTNMFQVYKDEKELDQALKDIGADVIKGGVRGATTGVASTAIRYGAAKSSKNAVHLLSDSSAATIMAGSMIDGGVSLYSYARGEINEDELQKSLVDTTVKSVTTIYFTKAVELAVGPANPFVPMAIYTAASYIVTSTREIIKNAKLNAAEYDRLRALLDQSTELIHQYRMQMNEAMSQYERRQRKNMTSLLNTFDYNISTGENYDKAIYAIVNFANQTGIALQHANFDDFDRAMISNDEFVMRR